MIRKTSKSAYTDLKSNGKQGSQKKVLLDIVDSMTKIEREKGVTLQEIVAVSELQINAVSGRINDLKKEGLIAECTKRKCKITDRMVTPVTIGSGDVGGVAHSNINDKKFIEEEQSTLDLGNTTRFKYPD